MTDDDNDDDVNIGDFTDILGEILGALFMASSVLDLDLAFGAADSNVDFDRTTLLSPLSPLPLPSPVLLCLLLLWSPLEISFHSHNHLFPLLVESCNEIFSLRDGVERWTRSTKRQV